eukprot:Tbor_TRINITY_DN3100_c0_g2::TRINITY_DN3100_c0_g2_i1::g.14735::m.14735
MPPKREKDESTSHQPMATGQPTSTGITPNTTNKIVTLSFTSARAAATSKSNTTTSGSNINSDVTGNNNAAELEDSWSLFYKEQEDRFLEFSSFAPCDPNTADVKKSNIIRTSSFTRRLSARQISGQFEEEIARTWEEDWEDEDPEDSYNVIMATIGRATATAGN